MREISKNKNTLTTHLNPKFKFKILTSNARGITLVSLIITIIVMLILVGITISVALNGGLIGNAQEAKSKTEKAEIQERDLLTGRIKIGYTWYDSIDDYIQGNPSKNQKNEYSEETKVLLKTNPDAEDEVEKSPYIKYNNMLWRVLYDADSDYGIQLIADSSECVGENPHLEKVTLGYEDEEADPNDFTWEYDEPTIAEDSSGKTFEDFKKSVVSYNNLEDKLNKEAEKYITKGNTDVVEQARSLGSAPDFSGDPNPETNFITSENFFSKFNNKLKTRK